MSKLTVIIGAKIDQLLSGLNAAKAKVASFGAGVKSSLGGVFGALGAGLSVAGLVVGAKKVIDDLDAINDASQRVGASAEDWQKLTYAAKMSGAEAADVETAFKKMAKVVEGAASGSASEIEALGNIGLRPEDLIGKGSVEQFKTIADALATITDKTTLAARAQELFGKSGTQLIPMLNDYRKLGDELERTGNIISGDAVDAAAAFNDSIDNLKTSITALAANTGFISFLNTVAATMKNIADLAGQVSFQLPGMKKSETKLQQTEEKNNVKYTYKTDHLTGWGEKNIETFDLDAAEGTKALDQKLIEKAQRLTGDKKISTVKDAKKRLNELRKKEQETGVATEETGPATKSENAQKKEAEAAKREAVKAETAVRKLNEAKRKALDMGDVTASSGAEIDIPVSAETPNVAANVTPAVIPVTADTSTVPAEIDKTKADVAADKIEIPVEIREKIEAVNTKIKAATDKDQIDKLVDERKKYIDQAKKQIDFEIDMKGEAAKINDEAAAQTTLNAAKKEYANLIAQGRDAEAERGLAIIEKELAITQAINAEKRDAQKRGLTYTPAMEAATRWAVGAKFDAGKAEKKADFSLSVAEQINLMKQEVAFQRLINQGKERQVAIAKELLEAEQKAAAAGTTLSKKDREQIVDLAGKQYDMTATDTRAELRHDPGIVNDQLSRVGGYTLTAANWQPDQRKTETIIRDMREDLRGAVALLTDIKNKKGDGSLTF